MNESQGGTMGHLKPTRDAHGVERLSFALILPRYLLIGQVVTISGFGAAIALMMGLAHLTDHPSNPFAAYADVLPGQPREAVEARGFDCWLRDYNYHDPTETRCILKLTEDTFSSVEVVYANGIIHQTSFMLRDSTISVGELVVMLNASEIQSHGSIYFTWQGQIGVAQLVRPSKHFSVLGRISQVTLTDTRLPKRVP